MVYEFEGYTLDTATQELCRDGELVAVEPQVLAVLDYLIAHRDRVVTKIELLDEVWGDRFVSESALTSRIKLARKACGDSGREQRIIKTIHGRGYRFVAPVVERPSGSSPIPPASTEGSRSIVLSGPSIVGRDAELAELDAAVGIVASGQQATVFVTGEAGAGKTTLVAEFLERNDGIEPWFSLRGRCLKTRSGVEPYFCLLDALTGLGHADPTTVRDALERVAPSWLSQLPALMDDATAQRIERRMIGAAPQRMLREGVEAFHELARHRPVVVVLEDLQWADDCTLDVLDLLVQSRQPVPLLLIGVARPDQGAVGEQIAAAAASGRATDLRLDDLDRSAVEALVRDRLAGSEPPEGLIEIVCDRSEGVPLFAQEILSTWLREGALDVGSGEVRLTVPPAELRATVPPTLLPLIERRLGDLDPDQIAVLEAAAVAGLTFDGAAVAAGLEKPVAEAESRLAVISRHLDYVAAVGGTTWPDGTVSTAYTFSHQLYRDAIYERTPVGRAAALHGRIGIALELGHRDQAGELVVPLADHFLHAGDAARAIDYLRLAGEQASARSAHGHALEFLTAALDHTEQLPSGPDRDVAELRVRVALGPALVATAGWFDESVASNYDRAVELSRATELGPEAASARYGLATVTELRGEFERTEELLSPLLQEELGELAMEAHELVACSTFHQGAFERSERNAGMVLDSWDEEAYSLLMARIAEHPASSCNSWLSLSSWFLGRSDESLERADRAVVLGERNRYSLATATQQRAMLHQLRNEPDACMEWAARTREVGHEQDFPMRVIQADIFRGWALGASGSPADGMSLIADGLDRFRAAGARLNEAYYLALHADTMIHGREPGEALHRLDEALVKMERATRSYFHASEVQRLRARALLLADGTRAVDAARAELTESQTTAESMGSPALLLRTLADRIDLETRWGDPDPWRHPLGEVVASYDGQRSHPDLDRARNLLDSLTS